MNFKYYLKNIIRAREQIRLYKPRKLSKPERMIEMANYSSAWKGLELIIEDILNTYKVGRKSCIEFGVEFGYSTAVFSNYFDKVVGIDTFEGDIHTAHKGDHFEDTKKRLSEFKNIELIKSDYKDWIDKDQSKYDFAHVDIVHNYEETFECGLWAVHHSDCTIFHDTESFPTVRSAVVDIAKFTKRKVLNYPFSNGLGIIVKK